ncbi:MAG: OmpA family protein [Myxococcales bacterium]|nr:OmpA family protein [Myxococcales bacterium]
MNARARRKIVVGVAVLLGVATHATSHAELSWAVHAEPFAARMLGARKGEQFTWGGGGLTSAELTLNGRLGVELAGSALGLSAGITPIPGMVATDSGSGFAGLAGFRLTPFGRRPSPDAMTTGGLWLSGKAGLADTGGLARGTVHAAIGFDLFAGGAWRGGPSLGFFQILETRSVVLPDDARIVTAGLHLAYQALPPPPPPPPEDDDRDRDRIRNSVDACPDDPEDYDAFQDTDGCPDRDNDRDQILDESDSCRDVPEDRDDFEDHDGCPEADNDKDQILDPRDSCRNVPEDRDQYQDEDGCPDPDNDSDGFLDPVDQCPNDAETVNGYADDDGCPDEQNVRVVGDEIILDERVYFRVNLADVEVRSWQLMEAVAKLLKANPQYELIRIQGHADETGGEEYNFDLSIRRSKAVRDMLVRFGVAPKRLHVEGFGERRPAQAGQAETALKRNRRVEFLILQRAGGQAEQAR